MPIFTTVGRALTRSIPNPLPRFLESAVKREAMAQETAARITAFGTRIAPHLTRGVGGAAIGAMGYAGYDSGRRLFSRRAHSNLYAAGTSLGFMAGTVGLARYGPALASNKAVGSLGRFLKGTFS